MTLPAKRKPRSARIYSNRGGNIGEIQKEQDGPSFPGRAPGENGGEHLLTKRDREALGAGEKLLAGGNAEVS